MRFRLRLFIIERHFHSVPLYFFSLLFIQWVISRFHVAVGDKRTSRRQQIFLSSNKKHTVFVKCRLTHFLPFYRFLRQQSGVDAEQISSRAESGEFDTHSVSAKSKVYIKWKSVSRWCLCWRFFVSSGGEWFCCTEDVIRRRLDASV